LYLWYSLRKKGIAGINWGSDVLVLDVYGLADEFARDAEDLMLAAEESTLLAQETAAVVLLAIAAGVAVLAARLKFPYTVALVIAP